MRRWPAILLALAACKSAGKPGVKDDAAVTDTPVGDGVAAAIDAPGLPACANPVRGSTVSLRRVNATNLQGILTIAASPPDDARLFVVEIAGKIRVFANEVLAPDVFLDLSAANVGPVAVGGEMGLLGLAFHPHYATNGQFFVYYTTGSITDNSLRDVVTRCTVNANNPDLADLASCTEILSIADPAINHNGGMIEFGADGYLYIGTGDGGGNGNLTRSQDLTQLLGKLLRIDVDHQAGTKKYSIPASNPYAAGGGAPEVFISGLRNPWRWSFDRGTGDLWIGDVGAATVEELDVLRPGEQAGANLGWSMYEGSNCFTAPCDPAGKVFPLDERQHAAGWTAIIAGQVYRGTCYPDLEGWHFYADEGHGGLSMARLRSDGALEIKDLTGSFPLHPTSIHADARGELYMTDVSGFVYHLEAGP